MDFEEKLYNVELRIKDPTLKPEYYIFDYDPEYELEVRKEVKHLKDKINNSNIGIKIMEFDLYEIILDILKSKGYLEKTFALENESFLLSKKAQEEIDAINLQATANAYAQAVREINGTDNIKDSLEQLKEMLDNGLITESEYEAKKAELLERL